MRFLISRTDAIGDVVLSLSLVDRILCREPEAEIHLLVRPQVAPMLERHPGIHATHPRGTDDGLVPLFSRLGPDAVLNLSHRDGAVVVAAKQAGVPIRVARARGWHQIRAATHVLWKGRFGTGRHESQNMLDFLAPFGWEGGAPAPPRLHLSQGELSTGERDLAAHPRPRLGLVLRGSGSGAHPSDAWWEKAQGVFHAAGWHPITLAPSESSELPATHLRGLMTRLSACDAVISPSTGPAHIAAALNVPLLVLMGLRPHHTPDRWAPLGARVQVVQYPGPEADLTSGMDRLDPRSLLRHLDRLR